MLRLRDTSLAAAAVKAKPKQVNKVEVTADEEPKEETQACAVTPRPKKPNRSSPLLVLPR